MKKYLLLSVALALLALTLIGCGPSKEQAGLGSEPPVLIVHCGESSVKALRGTYSWLYEENGKGVGTDADSVHPLMAKENMTALVCTETSAQLDFATAPESVSVCAWDTALWNRDNVDEQAVDAALSGEQTLTLLPYDAVYQVTAVWEEENGSGGTVHYSFYTSMQPSSAEK